MYPRISDIFRDLFGITLPLPIHSFGAMVAVGFLVAAWLLAKELDRLHGLGRVGSVRVPVPQKKGKKQKKKRVAMQDASPSVLVQTLTVLAVIGGIAGAKLFHILENFGRFTRDPFDMIFSTGGLTFLGGLIVAALLIVWYVRRKKLPVPVFADAFAPGLILGYGIGRIGCYLAGDGDWGVCSSLADKPSWLPAFLWSETFPNNVMGPSQTPVNVLDYEHCLTGADGVYPTMLYEVAMCVLLFGVLWYLRKHPFKAGWLFSLYFVFAGVERLLIEQIRVNNAFDVFGMEITQAEVLSVGLILAGIIGLVRTSKKRTTVPPIAVAEPVA